MTFQTNENHPTNIIHAQLTEWLNEDVVITNRSENDSLLAVTFNAKLTNAGMSGETFQVRVGGHGVEDDFGRVSFTAGDVDEAWQAASGKIIRLK